MVRSMVDSRRIGAVALLDRGYTQAQLVAPKPSWAPEPCPVAQPTLRIGLPPAPGATITGQAPGGRTPLAELIAGVGCEVRPAIATSGRPEHLHGVDRRRRAQAEVEPVVAGRQIAPASDALGHAALHGRLDDDLRPDAVAV